MFDLLVKGGTLPDGTVADIGIIGNRIAAVGRLEGDAGWVIDATGDLVSPPFVDPHFHMDATLSYGLPRVNASGTLLEGISLWGELREIATVEEMVDRAVAYCDWAVSMGLLAIRTHVDTTPDHLRGVEAMLEVKRRVAPYLDLQLVAFPQDGLYRTKTGRENVIRALDRGVDVVGGIPHFERTMEEGAESLRDLGRIAAERGLMWDVHCDETDDPLSRHVETMAREVTRHGLGGRAAGSHLTSMHSMDNYYVSKLLPLIAESGMTAIPNPLINITLQGRHDSYPKRRGLTRVKEMQAMGVPVGWGQDCVLDPWYSLGTADGHAGRGLHGATCRADDASGGNGALFQHGDRDQRADHEPAGLRSARRLPGKPCGAGRRQPDRGPAPAAGPAGGDLERQGGGRAAAQRCPTDAGRAACHCPSSPRLRPTLPHRAEP